VRAATAVSEFTSTGTAQIISEGLSRQTAQSTSLLRTLLGVAVYLAHTCFVYSSRNDPASPMSRFPALALFESNVGATPTNYIAAKI
jgi:hypothetical protein